METNASCRECGARCFCHAVRQVASGTSTLSASYRIIRNARSDTLYEAYDEKVMKRL